MPFFFRNSASSIAPSASATTPARTVKDHTEEAYEAIVDAEMALYFQLVRKLVASKKLLGLEPLGFWKIHAKELPCFAIVARKYLCTMITSVACEAFFSTTGNVLSAERSRLGFGVFRALSMLKANRRHCPASFALDYVVLGKRNIYKSVHVIDEDDESKTTTGIGAGAHASAGSD